MVSFSSIGNEASMPPRRVSAYASLRLVSEPPLLLPLARTAVPPLPAQADSPIVPRLPLAFSFPYRTSNLAGGVAFQSPAEDPIGAAPRRSPHPGYRTTCPPPALRQT